MSFIKGLEDDLCKNANCTLAIPMENYMKNNFSYLGIKTDGRRTLLKTHWENHKEEIKNNYRTIVWDLFTKNEREFHYCGIEILMKEIKKNYVIEDIQLIEKILITHSWWDSVDMIAKYLVGGYLQQFPDETFKVIERFSNSDTMWLNRTAIIFQLSYKDMTNFDLLKAECEKHK